jgi:hypothetical protein
VGQCRGLHQPGSIRVASKQWLLPFNNREREDFTLEQRRYAAFSVVMYLRTYVVYGRDEIGSDRINQVSLAMRRYSKVVHIKWNENLRQVDLLEVVTAPVAWNNGHHTYNIH